MQSCVRDAKEERLGGGVPHTPRSLTQLCLRPVFILFLVPLPPGESSDGHLHSTVGGFGAGSGPDPGKGNGPDPGGNIFLVFHVGLKYSNFEHRCKRSCAPSRGRSQGSHSGFGIHGFWAGRKSSMFGVWAAPAAGETQKVGRDVPQLLELVSGQPGPPRPRKSTISGRPRNHVLKTLVHWGRL
jgi:hypothetical protein